MPIEHRPPTTATIKQLYAHAYRCGYEDCRRPLFRVDDESGERTLNSLVCHIHARREGGPRWLASQSEQDNRSFGNLILMCHEHAAKIDDARLVSSFSPERLRSWKSEQVAEYDRLTQGWKINSELARQVADASFSNVGIAITHSTVQLGGQGGQAPGAGGGGGGAIGRNAVAGDGGRGGEYRVDEGHFTVAMPIDMKFDAKNFQTSEPFGAGGGGGGATGDEARAGGGGSGGDAVEALIDLEELRRAGWSGSADIIVPNGAYGNLLPGEHGNSGEDTKVVFRHRDGHILKEIVARGGGGGRSGSSLILSGYNELQLSGSDAALDFRVTTLMTCNAGEIRDNLVFILGGGWTNFPVSSLPYEAVWFVLCCACWVPSTRVEGIGIFLSLVDPKGRERACQALHLGSAALSVGNVQWLIPIGAHFDIEGNWHLRVHAGGYEFARFAVAIQTNPPPHVTKSE
jgi:hypothetical protein